MIPATTRIASVTAWLIAIPRLGTDADIHSLGTSFSGGIGVVVATGCVPSGAATLQTPVHKRTTDPDCFALFQVA
ncbi:MAG: hypothetical protein CMM01_20460 [Rhodopirellula sp.]|nr:hypothetical protein [Rhodopirellula sp.]